MVFTGGPLNYLYGQCRASNPHESIHVMNLVREHEPETPDDLYEEINRHYEEDCDCGLQGGGTIEDYGEWLYEAQVDHWGEHRFDLESCLQWIYDLFVMQSLKGHDLERKASNLFDRSFDVTEAEGIVDDEYRVDLIVEDGGEPIAGLQVKPESYQEMRETVKGRNRAAHAEIDEPIFYLYYDYETERFVNAESVMCELYELVNDD